MAIAGRVAIVPKGDWSAETEYKRLDEVTYNNTMFIAKKAVPKGTLPTNAEYWSKSIVGGVGAIATKEDAGIVKPADGLSIAEDGTLKVSIDGTTLTMDQVNNVIKLADTLKEKINGAFPAANVVNNQITTETGYALDARQANPNIAGTLAKQISDLNGSLGNLKVLTCDSFEALDTELSNMLTNTPYIAVIPGGYGMLFGLKNNSDYQRQLRMTYWDNVLYSRVKTNSTKWSEWVNVNDITKFIDIPSNANLNDIKFFNVGKYRCYSNMTAETVLNSPFKTAFTMEVYYSAGTSNYVAQKATEFATGHCKWRMRETRSGKLQDWVQLY
jgi:hypothetical protein|nr:MAG TPA: Baseplate component [Caudoviricetes sp.]